MKQPQYEKMESMFHLIQHEWQEINPLELVVYQLAQVEFGIGHRGR